VVVSAVFDSGKMYSPNDVIKLNVDGNYTTGQICVHYNDSSGRTSYFTFYVSNASNTQIYNITSTSSVATLCYTVPVKNASYIWRVHISHPDGSEWDVGNVIDMLTGIIRKLAPLENNGITSIIGFSVSDVYKYIALIGVIGIGALFGAADAFTGGIVVFCGVLFFTFVGWLDLSAVTVAVLGILSILGVLHKGQNS
jgi:hypothetical protein